jgi:hypothetical protein
VTESAYNNWKAIEVNAEGVLSKLTTTRWLLIGIGGVAILVAGYFAFRRK